MTSTFFRLFAGSALTVVAATALGCAGAATAQAAANTVFHGTCSATLDYGRGPYLATAGMATTGENCRVRVDLTCKGDNGRTKAITGPWVLTGSTRSSATGSWSTCTARFSLNDISNGPADYSTWNQDF
ncbi:hypothetical protein [Amycolatopsis sp. NPDC004169]|uniref:hypothetical protein n=1 Tax=Amycolatopsis sp. NPDC004169 TaxID=3154453 RepID=UPI0033A99E09